MTELQTTEIDAVDGGGALDVIAGLYTAVKEGIEIGYAVGYWLGSH